MTAGLFAASLAVVSSHAAAPASPQGLITAREFRGITGTAVANLTASTKFPNSPDLTDYPPYFEWPISAERDININPPGNVRNDYGVQIVGYFYPPTTGNYTFAIAADDGAELWLSTDSDPSKKKRIAIEPTWNGVRVFTGGGRRNVDFPENNSSTYQATEWQGGAGAPITLTANTPYYIEALMKEGGGGDNLAVAVQDPGFTINFDQPIPGQYLSSIDRTSLATPYFGEVTRPSPIGFDLAVYDGEGAGARTVTSATAKLNGATIPVTVATAGGNKYIRYRVTIPGTGATGVLPAGTHSVEATLTDSGGGTQTVTKSFTIASYATIPASQKLAAPATTPGLTAFIHQIDEARTPGDVNSPANAEQQFAGGMRGADGNILPNVAGETGAVNISYVNWEQASADVAGENFNATLPVEAPIPNEAIPGIPGNGATADEHIVGEISGYLQLTRGVHRMGVNSDDGFRVTAGLGADSPTGILLGQFTTGRGAADTMFDFVVEEDGFYPTRLLWWEGTGGAGVEWFTEDLNSYARLLVNGPGASVKAFRNGAGRAHVDSILPANGYTGGATNQVVTVVISDDATTVVNGSVKLQRNGADAVPAPVVTKSGALTTVTWTPNEQLPFGSTQNFTLIYQEGANSVTNAFSFTVRQMNLSSLPQPLFFIEAEDFNYDGGLTNPLKGVDGSDVDVMPYYGGAYDQLGAIKGIDFNNNDSVDANNYRTEADPDPEAGDPEGTNEVSMDSNTVTTTGNGLGGTIPLNAIERGSWDMTINYKIGWIGTGDWFNYTRTIPAGWYTARAALSVDVSDPDALNATLDRVTSDPKVANQTVENLGRFLAPGSGGWGNNNLVPMTTAAGAPASFKHNGGAVTFRFNANRGDFNYFLLHPVPAPPPSISGVPTGSVKRDAVQLTWTLTDSDTPVNVASVKLKVDGADVPAAKVTVTKTGTGATVVYNDSGTLAAVGDHTWELTFAGSSTPVSNVTGSGTFKVNPLHANVNAFVIEAEDFNYSTDNVTGGLSNPLAGQAGKDVNTMPYLGAAYLNLGAVKGVDYNSGDGNDGGIYRTEVDPVGGTENNEVGIGQDITQAYTTDRGSYSTTDNYRIGWVALGDWHNYTRTFPQGTYQIWAGMSHGDLTANAMRATLQEVTAGAATSSQTLSPSWGSFNAAGTGSWGRNELVPLRDSAGAIVTKTLGGAQTVRLNTDSGDVDFIAFIPMSSDPGGAPRFTSVVKNANGSISITWTGGGTLESSTSITGPWTAVPGATSPYVLTPPAGTTTLFGRIRK